LWGELILRRIGDLHVVEYRARCRGCPWAEWLREFRCGGCHGRRLFKWTGEVWSCLLCGHVRGDQSPPRALDGYGPSEPRGLQPDGAETPPRHGSWSRGEVVGRILEAIPCDRWVGAAEISAETGISSRRVAGIIRRNLLGADVERKLTGSSWSRRHLYRRLHRVGKIKSSRGTLIQLGNTISSWRGE